MGVTGRGRSVKEGTGEGDGMRRRVKEEELVKTKVGKRRKGKEW